MAKPTKRKNETFWPDDLVEGERGALGWTPIARVLMANWRHFHLGGEYFATLVWLLSWVRKDFSNVRYVQVAIANQQGVDRTTIYRQMNKLEAKGIVKFNKDGTLSLAPFMETLAVFEAERRREVRERKMDETMKAVGILEDQGGRPRKPDQPSTAQFGVPWYDDLCEEDSAWQFVAAGTEAGSRPGGEPMSGQHDQRHDDGWASSPGDGSERMPARFGKPGMPPEKRAPPPPPEPVKVDYSFDAETQGFLDAMDETERRAKENPPTPEEVEAHRRKMDLRRIAYERVGGYAGRPMKHSTRVEILLRKLDRRLAGEKVDI